MLNKLIFFLCLINFSVTVYPQTEPPKNQPAESEARSDRIPDGINLIQGKVYSVYNGDTIRVQDQDDRKYTIRLHAIDAPEGLQKYSDESREALIKLILGKSVVVTISKKDLHDRYLGIVYSNGQDVGLLQIKAGMAWHYKLFSGEQTPLNRERYEKAQREAQAARVGLWNDPNPKPPWDQEKEDTGKGVTTDKLPKADKDLKTIKTDRQYIRGPRGGCYYINASGNKSYVDRKLCN